MLGNPPLKSASREDQLRAIDENGVLGALNWGDVFFDIEANRMAATLYGEAVARIVKDPETAASLVPDHPFACKRPIIDQGYYETFNRDNVTLVDLRKAPIREVTATGIRTEHESLRSRCDHLRHRIRCDDRRAEPHRHPRPRRRCRLATSGPTRGRCPISGWRSPAFPNLFTIQGPGSPERRHATSSPRSNNTWSGSATALRTCAPTVSAPSKQRPRAQQDWIDHATSLVAATVLVHPSCNSWYNGGNVPGKKRMYMGYTGGIPEYRRRCDEIAAAGYTGFTLA